MIVKSILDTDLYKFTTSYAYMKLFPQARGTFEFFDRDLTEYPEDFVQKVYLELSNLGMLRLTRCRMIHLYDIASIRKGLVMSTDNQTEYQLGFWTIHGDVGDFDPIQDLWKTEVYGLANYLQDHYKSKALRNDYKAMSCAIYNSCKLVPTDGLGISNSDLDQIGAKDYATVDDILSRFIPFENFRKSYDSAGQIMHPHDEMAESDCWSQLCARHGEDVVNKVWSRHLASEFKRKKAPIYISRELYE
jgi:NAD+ synthetase